MSMLAKNISTLQWHTVALATASLAVILFVPRLTRRIPGSIIALVLATGCVVVFALPVATIGSAFGGIPTGLPRISIPTFRPDLILPLIPSALTVALLAAVESLLSAVVADSMTGDRHNSNVELVAQGIANMVSPLFGGIPATGAIARTATNVRSGAKSPVAGMIHALTLLMILLVAAPLARFVPLATLAAVLFVVAYNMGEWKEIGVILRRIREALGLEQMLEVVHRHIEHDVAVHLEEAAIRVVGEARIATLLREADHRAIVEPEIEDGLHHPRHRHGRARAHGDEERILRIAEAASGHLLEPREILLDLRLQLRACAAALQVVEARRACDREAGGHGNAEIGHLGEICPLAPQYRLHVPRAIRGAAAKKVYEHA